MRPRPSAVGTRFWVTTPCSVEASCTRTWPCCSAGKTSMTRSIVVGALWVCSVANTRWPVSAAVSAVRDRLQVAHLADEDHVGVLAERRAEALGERRRVLADLALVDDAGPVPVQELDRVLDREDVLVAGVVDVVEQRRERRRLARAGRAGDEHEAARLVGELVEPRGQSELVERLDLVRDQPEGGADGSALEVGVDAEAREPGDRVGEVDLPARLEGLLLLGREDPVEERPRAPRASASRESARRSRRPLTRITGGEPAVRWRSDALCSTITASSSSIE